MKVSILLRKILDQPLLLLQSISLSLVNISTKWCEM